MPEPAQVCILMVDDQESNLVALEACLESLGAYLVPARSGEEALRELLLRDFAAILLDVQMPGMDGFETADLIRRRDRTRHVPILFLTAINKSDTHVLRGYALGAVDYMFKPIVPEILRSKVQVFVELFRMRQRETFIVEALAQKTRELERINGELRQFANSVATQIKDPLQELVRDLAAVEAPGSVGLASARRRAALATDVVDDLLEQARAGTQPLAPEPIDVADALHRVIEGLDDDDAPARAHLTSGELPRVLADPGQLVLVLRALVGGVLVDRRSTSGTIAIDGERLGSECRINVRLDPAPETSQVERGLAPGAYRTASTAAALRLGTARSIVERHGGSMGTERDGSALVTWFTLPSAADEADIAS